MKRLAHRAEDDFAFLCWDGTQAPHQLRCRLQSRGWYRSHTHLDLRVSRGDNSNMVLGWHLLCPRESLPVRTPFLFGEELPTAHFLGSLLLCC